MVACVHGPRPVFPAFSAARYYAAVFPALENLLLAAHSLGLGATITTLPIWSGWQARRTLGLPWNVAPVAVVPLGWPKEPKDPTRAGSRYPSPVPMTGLVHHDLWGNRSPNGSG